MKIVVCLKQTFDTEAKIQLDASGKISQEGIQFIINPYDEFAVEEAVRIKERLGNVEITVLSLGTKKTEEALRQALAMGADKAILLQDPIFEGLDSHGTAVALSKALSRLEYDLILGGWAAIDDSCAQVMTRVAERLNLPQVNVVTKIELEDGKAVCHREADGATEIIEVPLPAVVTAQKGLNEPRYPSLKGIMQAKKKELKVLDSAALGLSPDDVKPYVRITQYFLPEKRKQGKILEGELPGTAQELVRLLREEAKVV